MHPPLITDIPPGTCNNFTLFHLFLFIFVIQIKVYIMIKFVAIRGSASCYSKHTSRYLPVNVTMFSAYSYDQFNAYLTLVVKTKILVQ